jgi:hypothetical protein
MARRKRHILFLSLFLVSPFVVVTGLILVIMTTNAADRADKQTAVGVGASDTGGANALGELLAGNDPDEVQRRKRAIREGVAVLPTTVAGPVEVSASSVPRDAASVVLEIIERDDVVRTIPLSRAASGGWSASINFTGISPAARTRLVIDGITAQAVMLPLVASDGVILGTPAASLDWIDPSQD